MYYTYLPMPAFRGDPNRYSKACWCIASVDDDGQTAYLTGIGMVDLTMEEAKQKADKMSNQLDQIG